MTEDYEIASNQKSNLHENSKVLIISRHLQNDINAFSHYKWENVVISFNVVWEPYSKIYRKKSSDNPHGRYEISSGDLLDLLFSKILKRKYEERFLILFFRKSLHLRFISLNLTLAFEKF